MVRSRSPVQIRTTAPVLFEAERNYKTKSSEAKGRVAAPPLIISNQRNSMSQDNIVKMQCPACKNINYWTRKNKKTTPTKLELAKFCKSCRKHVAHKETKK